MTTESGPRQARVRPVELRWSAQQERLVEVERRSRIRLLGGFAVRIADTMARRSLLRGSTQRLTPRVEQAINNPSVVYNANTLMTLPIDYPATDLSMAAIDASWYVRGMTKNGQVIVTDAPGIISHDLVGQGYEQRRRAWARARDGAWQPPSLPNTRTDSAVEDPGGTLYVVGVEDLTAATTALNDAWAAESADPQSRARAQQVMDEWQAAAAILDVEDAANQYGANRLGPDDET